MIYKVSIVLAGGEIRTPECKDLDELSSLIYQLQNEEDDVRYLNVMSTVYEY